MLLFIKIKKIKTFFFITLCCNNVKLCKKMSILFEVFSRKHCINRHNFCVKLGNIPLKLHTDHI